MITRKFTCQDLRDNTIDVDAIGEIAKDCGKYQILGLKIKMNRYTLNQERLPRKVGINRSTVEVLFSKTMKNEVSSISMDAKVRFFSHGSYYTICMKLTAEADYANYKPYEAKVQSYLYSYFAHVIEHDIRLRKFGQFYLPEALSNYTPGMQWMNQELQDYHWIDIQNKGIIEVPESFALQKMIREDPLAKIFREIGNIRK